MVMGAAGGGGGGYRIGGVRSVLFANNSLPTLFNTRLTILSGLAVAVQMMTPCFCRNTWQI